MLLFGSSCNKPFLSFLHLNEVHIASTVSVLHPKYVAISTLLDNESQYHRHTEKKVSLDNVSLAIYRVRSVKIDSPTMDLLLRLAVFLVHSYTLILHQRFDLVLQATFECKILPIFLQHVYRGLLKLTHGQLHQRTEEVRRKSECHWK